MSPTNHFGDDEQQRWTLAQIYDDLTSKENIPRALNVTEARLHNWIRRREEIKCPYPIKRLSGVDIYSMQEWRDWYARWEAAHENDKSFAAVKPHGHGESFWSYFARDMERGMHD